MKNAVVTKLAAWAVLVAAISPAWAGKGNADNPGIAPSQSVSHGLAYGEWAAKWWQWALSIPADQNPITDPTGQFAGVGQSGPVWFLAGTLGGNAARTVSVPAGKAIFMPVYNWIFGSSVWDCDPTNPGVPCDVPTLRQKAADNTTSALVVEAWIDGVQVQNIRNYRGISPNPFPIEIPEVNLLGNPAGIYYPQVADGYWLMLAPFAVGTHIIIVHGIPAPSVGSEFWVTYHLTVGPIK
jgi:hypothetical protein